MFCVCLRVCESFPIGHFYHFLYVEMPGIAPNRNMAQELAAFSSLSKFAARKDDFFTSQFSSSFRWPLRTWSWWSRGPRRSWGTPHRAEHPAGRSRLARPEHRRRLKIWIFKEVLHQQKKCISLACGPWRNCQWGGNMVRRKGVRGPPCFAFVLFRSNPTPPSAIAQRGSLPVHSYHFSSFSRVKLCLSWRETCEGTEIRRQQKILLCIPFTRYESVGK